jgi:uncharacterized repeat protein (TIGR01451 family)
MKMRLYSSFVRRGHGGHLLAALALAASSSCATSDAVARRKPAQLDATPAVRSIAPSPELAADPAVEHAVVDESSPMGRSIQPLGHTADEKLVRTRSVEFSGFVASGQSPEPLCEPIPYLPVPRVPVMGCPPGTICPPPGPLVAPEEPPYPEEMLCDGGDAGLPFHYEGSRFSGLEPEDTVAEFVDHEGTAHVRISSQACVYAPKFGAVRSISQPVLDFAYDRLGGTHDRTEAAGMENRKPLIVSENVDQLADTRGRSRASGVDSDVTERSMQQTVGPEQHIKLVNVFEDRNSTTDGQFQQTTEAYLAADLQIAGESASDIAPIIVANDVFGQAVTSIDSTEAYVGVEDKRPPGNLRIVKLADQPAAQPGDTLTFRIRFYNDGGRPLTSVRILDHLSPRLEYVADSVSSELEGKLTVENNEFGGQILQFELATPLEGGTSGEISFQAIAK